MLDLPRSADVVIVGAGFAGLSTAWALAERGISDVLVLERERALGAHASGRAAGLGRQLAEDDPTTALTVRGATLLRSQLAAAWTQTGGILTFDNVDHARAYEERAARFGIEIEPITRDMVLGYWPWLDGVEIVAALRVPSDGVISVSALSRQLAAGREIALGVAVTGVDPLQGGARVKTSRGDVVARVVVDAAGAWAGQALGDAPLPSYKRHLYTLGVQADLSSPFVWHLGTREIYVRAYGDAVLTSPCDATEISAGDQQPDPEGRAMLQRVLAGNALATKPMVLEWACQRTFTPEGTMRLARDPARPWLVWAAGLGGHGATASAAVGETVASVVRDLL